MRDKQRRDVTQAPMLYPFCRFRGVQPQNHYQIGLSRWILGFTLKTDLKTINTILEREGPK
jgi:hypothetical protein